MKRQNWVCRAVCDIQQSVAIRARPSATRLPPRSVSQAPAPVTNGESRPTGMMKTRTDRVSEFHRVRTSPRSKREWRPGNPSGRRYIYLFSRTAALSASALNASRTSGAADTEKGSEAVRSISDIQKEVKSLGDHGARCDDSRAAQIGMTSAKSVVSEQPKKA